MNFVYFFKHRGVKGIKIGRTSGESVNHRFDCFKVYSPFGADLIGFIEVDNAIVVEAALHARFDQFRMSGEFFDITETTVEAVIHEFGDKHQKAKSAFNQWISSGTYSIENVIRVLDSLNKNQKKIEDRDLDYIIDTRILPSGERKSVMTIGEICTVLGLEYDVSISKSLKTRGFDSYTVKRRVNGILMAVRGFAVKVRPFEISLK